MATNENLIPIPGRLHSVATEGHVAGADEIYDDTLGKLQSEINASKADLVNGKVPSEQLPSYVDDVINGYYYNGSFYKEAAHTTVITGEEGKIYVDIPTDKSYRWSGSAYILISNPYSIDEEDLTVVNNNIKFKDRPNTDGMGRVILRKNIVSGVNTLTQDMMPVATGGNTIYVIQYDFTLGENITVPANCVLEFDGGSISGGTITSGENCIYNSPKLNECSLELTNNNTVNKGYIHGDTKTFLIKISGASNVVIKDSEIFTTPSYEEDRNCSPIFVKNSNFIKILNSKVSGSAFDGESSYYEPDNTYSAIYCLTSSNITIDGCILHNTVHECLYCEGCSSTTITNCEMYDSYYSGISSNGGDDIVITSNHVHHTGTTSILSTDNKAVIANNIVHHNNYNREYNSCSCIAIGHSSGATLKYGIIDSNIVYDYIGIGIAASNCNAVIIGNNIKKETGIDVNDKAILIRNDCISNAALDIVIEANKVNGTYNAITSSVGTGYKFRNITISSNNINDCKERAFAISGCIYAKINNNYIKDVPTVCSVNGTENISVSNNTIRDYSSKIFHIYSATSLKFDNNTVYTVNSSTIGLLYYENTAGSRYSSACTLSMSDNNIYGNNGKFIVIKNDVLRNDDYNIFYVCNNNMTLTSMGSDNVLEDIIDINGNNEGVAYTNKISLYLYDNIINSNPWDYPRIRYKANAPYVPDNYRKNARCFVKSENRFIVWNGRSWNYEEGNASERPDLRYAAGCIGFEYFDTSLTPARPIYWNGTAWVDATGAQV